MEGGPIRRRQGQRKLIAWRLLWVGVVAMSTAAGGGCQEPRIGTSNPPSGSRPITERIVLLGDTHAQYPLGWGIDQRSTVVDRAVWTAIRPPQLDLSSRSLLHEACRATACYELAAGPQRDACLVRPGTPANAPPVIHLGDVGNMPCVQEYDEFLHLMDQCRVRGNWVLMPGNHDGYFNGGTDRESDIPSWNDACGDHADGEPKVNHRLTKDRFLEKYTALLRALVPRENQHPQPADAPSPEGELVKLEFPGSHFLVRAAWQIWRTARWRSFVLQEIILPGVAGAPQDPKVYGILLDTVQFDDRPAVLPQPSDAGMSGSVLETQRSLVREWIGDILGGSAPAQRANVRIVLFGHHPLRRLEKRTYQFVFELINSHPEIVAYVSAHTHEPYFWRYGVANRQLGLLEVNVGSLTDYPNEYRDFRLMVGDDHQLWLESTLNPGRRPPVCPEPWMPAPEEYLHYRQAPGLAFGTLQNLLLIDQARTWLRELAIPGPRDPEQARRERVVAEGLERALGATEGQSDLLRVALGAARAVVGDPFERATQSPVPADATGFFHREQLERCIALRAARQKFAARQHCVAGCENATPLELVSDPVTADRQDWLPLAPEPGETPP